MKGDYSSKLQLLGALVHALPWVFVPLGGACAAVLGFVALRPALAWRSAAVALGVIFLATYALKALYDRGDGPVETDLLLDLSGGAFALLAGAALVKLLLAAVSR